MAFSLAVAAIIVAAIFYLHYDDPVCYVRLISEDSYGEYATSAGFAFAGILLVTLAFRDGPGLRRWVWAFMGAAALVIAAEEISWGQRIFGIAPPDAFIEANTQKEMNLHNLGAVWEVNKRLHQIAAYLILGWLVLSVVLSLAAPALKQRLLDSGVPLIPLGLVPLFLLPPLFVLNWTIVKSDEIAELTLALAAVAWAARLFVREVGIGPPASWRGAGAMAGAFLLVVTASTLLTHQFPGALGWRLNMTAARDYPRLGMYDQAEALFDYILAQPEHIRPDTRSNYEEVLRLAALEERRK
ncbi:hypothetical protein [Virgifigura deserti]|uniref:hypothetical protein n=1 Tax=Virgifigura deserti TaxID=2268457 RepID=UPI003CCB86B5